MIRLLLALALLAIPAITDAQSVPSGGGISFAGSSCITISSGTISIPATCSPTLAGITSTGTIGSGATFIGAVGLASATSYGFLGGTNDGMFTIGAGNVSWATSGTERLRLTTSQLQLLGSNFLLFWGTGVTAASLGTPANGNIIYCSDCTIANPCAGGGSGALAKRLNATWVCN